VTASASGVVVGRNDGVAEELASRLGAGSAVPLGVLPSTVALKYTDWVPELAIVPKLQVRV